MGTVFNEGLEAWIEETLEAVGSKISCVSGIVYPHQNDDNYMLYLLPAHFVYQDKEK